MHHDQSLKAAPSANRPQGRKEWEPVRERQHQMEAREHARQANGTSQLKPSR